LESLESIAVLGLHAVLKEAHSSDILQIWYHSIDKHCILSHVEFEDELYISVLKNRGNSSQKLQLEIEKFLKKSIFQSPPTFPVSHPAFFMGRRIGACQIFQDEWDIFKRVKS
jgi:hypothetical protein